MGVKVLVIAPHPDDEAIGCGGAIALHKQRGDTVHLAVLTSGERGIPNLAPAETVAIREAETRAAARVLGIDRVDFLRLADSDLLNRIDAGAARLRGAIDAATPSLIYLPHENESHHDHQAVLPMVRAALAGGADGGGDNAPLPELRAYEVWTPMERFGWPEDITSVMAVKLAAVRCYKSQLTMFRYDRACRGLAAYRGTLAGHSRYAEVFRYVSAKEDS